MLQQFRRKGSAVTEAASSFQVFYKSAVSSVREINEYAKKLKQ